MLQDPETLGAVIHRSERERTEAATFQLEDASPSSSHTPAIPYCAWLTVPGMALPPSSPEDEQIPGQVRSEAMPHGTTGPYAWNL